MSSAQHPQVAQMMQQAESVLSLLDEQVRRMNADSFVATHHTGTVEVTTNGHLRLTNLTIHPDLLVLGAQEASRVINETISAATDYVNECIQADVGDLEGRIADALADLRDSTPPT